MFREIQMQKLFKFSVFLKAEYGIVKNESEDIY